MKKKMIYLALLPLVLACTQKEVSGRLDEVDSLLSAEQYDSAYSVLMEIDRTTITETDDKARYHLLFTQAGYATRRPVPADSLLDEAIAYYEQQHNQSRLADGYYYKSNQELYKGELSQAILYAKKAEQLAQGIGQQYKVAERLCYLNERSGNHTLQLEYARKSLELALSAHNNNWTAYAYNNIGASFAYLGNNDSAGIYFEKVKPYIKYVDERNKPSFIVNIGIRYKYVNPEKTKEYFLEALKYKEASGIYDHLADVYYKQGQQEKAYELWKKALTIEDGDYKDNIIYSILSYDLEHGRIEQACDNLDEIIYLKDSMLNKLKNDTIKDMQLHFDREVAMLQQEQVISAWKIRGLIAVVLVLILVAYIVLKRYKTENLIQKIQIEITECRDQIRELEKSNEDASELIETLNNQIRKELEKLPGRIKRGQMYYEQIRDGELNSIYQWTTADEKMFVEFYDVMDHKTVRKLMSAKRVEKLTTHRLFYLLLKEMGKNDHQIKELLGISNTAIKVLKSRTREIKTDS